MTRDDILTMASEAYCWRINLSSDRTASLERLKRFAELVAAEEREACIKLIEDFSKTTMVPVRDTWVMGLIAGANALRERVDRD